MSLLYGILVAAVFVLVMLFLTTVFGIGLGMVELVILMVMAFSVAGLVFIVANHLKNSSNTHR